MQTLVETFRQSRHKDTWLALFVTIFIAGLGLFLGWDKNHVFISFPTAPGFHYTAEPHNALSFFSEWDSADYIQIAKHGYTNLFWINWFPLYPIAINLVNHLIPSPLDSAITVSWASLVGAIYFYLKIARRLFKLKDDLEPLRALLFFVLFPTGVFLIAPFSESLYALLALGAIYFALEKRVAPAALLTLLCTATHITGPFVAVLVAQILREEGESLGVAGRTAAIGCLGLLTYMAFLFNRFDHPLGFLESQQIYHHWTSYGFLNLITSATPSRILSVALLVLAARYWWNRRRSFAVYSLLFLLIPLIGRQYGGFNRYVLMAFPVELMLYGWFRNKPKLFPVVAALFCLAWTQFLLQYAGGYIGS